MKGPGKYDKLCTFVRMETDADVAIVIVIAGNQGSGFSVQSQIGDAKPMLADLLESMAKDLREGKE